MRSRRRASRRGLLPAIIARRPRRSLAAGIPTERIRAGVLPGDKAAPVGALQAAGAVVAATVGDGTNDAPALRSRRSRIATDRCRRR